MSTVSTIRCQWLGNVSARRRLACQCLSTFTSQERPSEGTLHQYAQYANWTNQICLRQDCHTRRVKSLYLLSSSLIQVFTIAWHSGSSETRATALHIFLSNGKATQWNTMERLISPLSSTNEHHASSQIAVKNAHRATTLPRSLILTAN